MVRQSTFVTIEKAICHGWFILYCVLLSLTNCSYLNLSIVLMMDLIFLYSKPHVLTELKYLQNNILKQTISSSSAQADFH